MMSPHDLKVELEKIRVAVHTKRLQGPKPDPQALVQGLWGKVIEDLSKTGDQRTRTLIRLMQEFKL